MTSVYELAATFTLAGVVLFAIKQYFRGGKFSSNARIDGKVIIVTGANAGIGKETAKELVKRGGKVYLACRSLDKAKAAADEIAKATGQSHMIKVMQLNLGSLDAVREFVAEFKKKEDRLDILVNNAGVMMIPYNKTVDGYEETFGVNHLAHFLLTYLLLDLLKHSTPSRIINVSGDIQKMYGFHLEDIMYERRPYNKLEAYCQSKTANILFTRELARRFKGTGVTAYSLHPGVVRTQLLRHSYQWILKIFHGITWFFTKDCSEGAQTTLYCALLPELSQESGAYYKDCRETKPSVDAQNDDYAKQLWDLSLKLCGCD